MAAQVTKQKGGNSWIVRVLEPNGEWADRHFEVEAHADSWAAGQEARLRQLERDDDWGSDAKLA